MKLKIKYVINEASEKSFLEQVMQNRGVSLDWLKADKEQMLDGSKLKNFDAAKELLESMMKAKKKTYIEVDKDPDGFCSTSMLAQWIKEKYDVEVGFIMPEGKVHGIMIDLIPEDAEFLLVPDSGTSEIENHKKLKEKGIPVLVMDHHEFTTEESEFAVILNPMNPNCPFENKNLSGTGVTYKFMEAIDKSDGVDLHSKYLDLVAIATVADMMDLTQIDNKALVNLGLSEIKNPFFKAAIMADSRVKEKNNITPMTIGFYVIPPINATIRVGTLEEQMNMLRAMAGLEPAEVVVAHMMKLKRKQDTAKEPAIIKMVMNLQKNGGDKHQVIFAQTPPTTQRSMTGLLAGQLASMYSRPCFLSSKNENGIIGGSARTVNNSTIENLKDFCEESGLFDWVAGHQGAFGWQMKEENLEKFLEYCRDNLPPFEKVYHVDFSLNGLSDPNYIIEEVAPLKEHFGPGFPELLVSNTFRLEPSNFKIIGQKNTLVFYHNDVEYIMFGFKGELPMSEVAVTVVGKPDINTYMGNSKPQIIVTDLDLKIVL